LRIVQGEQVVERGALRELRVVDAELRQRKRRFEAVPLDEEGIGNKLEEVLRVPDAAVA
jgi:hypothetical protein